MFIYHFCLGRESFLSKTINIKFWALFITTMFIWQFIFNLFPAFSVKKSISSRTSRIVKNFSFWNFRGRFIAWISNFASYILHLVLLAAFLKTQFFFAQMIHKIKYMIKYLLYIKFEIFQVESFMPKSFSFFKLSVINFILHV